MCKPFTKCQGVIHLKSIARVYGDHGTEILELLRRNPAGSIPIILNRLKQKELEWCKVRQDMNKSWREIQEKNYYKSLDHRSFYFKQQDRRYISPKSLFLEIKQRHDEKVAGRDIDASLRYRFPDSSIHVDVFSSIIYYCTSGSERKQVFLLWDKFVIPFFKLYKNAPNKVSFFFS